MPEATEEELTRALATVQHPDYGKPLLELGLLRNITLKGSRAQLTVSLNAPSEALQRSIHQALEQAIASLPVQDLAVDWELEVPMRATAAEDPAPGVRNVILVMSGKGGVGKSTCAVNLALSLSRSGARVGILDADIYGPSIPTMLGVSDNPRTTDGKKIEPLSRFGVKLMSIGFMVESDKDAIIWRGPMLMSALNQFLGDVDWGELDYLVLDMPPGTGDVAITLGQRIKSTGTLIVTTPQEVALQDVYKSVSMCEKLGLPILGVVENMSFFVDSAGVRQEIFGSGGGERVAEFAKAPLLAQIPLEPKVRQWGDDGTPLVQAEPDSEVAVAFRELADRLARDIAKQAFKAAGGERAPSLSGPRRLKIVR